MSINDHLIQGQLTAAKPEYPIVYMVQEEMELVRVMLELQPMRYAFLLKHPEGKHWNGYFLFSENLWDNGDSIAARNVKAAAGGYGLEMSFAGNSNHYITWVTSSARNSKMSKRVNLGVAEDFWVGFDTLEVDREWTVAELQTVIAELCNLAWNVAAGWGE